MTLSIKLRLAAAAAAMAAVLVVAGSAVQMFFVGAHMRELLGDEQLRLVTHAAADLDMELRDAHAGLVKIAGLITQDLASHPDELERNLANRPYLRSIFDEVLVRSADGQVLVDLPVRGRRGTYAPELQHIGATVQTREPQISRPFRSPRTAAPFVSMTAPVLDAKGKVIAVLIGALDLTKPNILGRIANNRFRKSGDFALMTLDREIVVSPDEKRMLTSAETAGETQYLDRALAEPEGWVEGGSGRGARAIISYKRLRTVPWVLIAEFPVTEAYAPIAEAHDTIVAIAAMLILILAPSIWLLTNYLLSPLTRLCDSIARLIDDPGRKGRVAVETKDEIGQLGVAFNELMDKRQRAEQALVEFRN